MREATQSRMGSAMLVCLTLAKEGEMEKVRREGVVGGSTYGGGGWGRGATFGIYKFFIF